MDNLTTITHTIAPSLPDTPLTYRHGQTLIYLPFILCLIPIIYAIYLCCKYTFIKIQKYVEMSKERHGQKLHGKNNNIQNETMHCMNQMSEL